VPRVGVAKTCVWKCLWEVLFSENIKNDDNIVYLYCDFGVNQYLLLWKTALCCASFHSIYTPPSSAETCRFIQQHFKSSALICIFSFTRLTPLGP